MKEKEYIKVNVVDQYKTDMKDYGEYINKFRAIPDFRDGLKIVQRRILYAASKKPNNELRKSADIVGTTMGSFHPHGDASIYNTMKPMTNWFEQKIPLLEGKGNWGSIQGDTQAAMRYTECRLSQFSLDVMLNELKSESKVVDWMNNFNNTTKEPIYLPAAIPLLLINGSFGLGLGMMCSISAHNINEVIDTTIALIDDVNAPICLVPDHCTSCEIVDTDFKEICDKGYGSYTVRGVIKEEEFNIGKQTYKALVIKSLPDSTTLETITNKLESLIEKNLLPQVHTIMEDPNMNKLDFKIVLKKGSDPNFVKQVLYKHTDLMKTVTENFKVIMEEGEEPVRLSYRGYLLAFLAFRKETKFRWYANKIQDLNTKISEKSLYIKLLESGEIDKVINYIKEYGGTEDDKIIRLLIDKCHMTDLEALFIIKSDIRKLSKGYLKKYKQEISEYQKEFQKYITIITDDNKIMEEIKKELLWFKEKYGTPRRCKIISKGAASNIPEGMFKIIITENNFIKKVGLNEKIGSFKNDKPKFILKADNTKSIIIFDKQGRVYNLPVSKVSFSDYGLDIKMLIKNCTSDIVSVIHEPIIEKFSKAKSKYFLVVISSMGYIKKLDLTDFSNVPPSGIIYTKLDKNDYVQDILIVHEMADVIIYSDKKALRINMVDIPYLKRNTRGSRSIDSKDLVDGISIIHPNATDIVILTSNGYANRFNISGLPLSSRGKAGNKVIKLKSGDKISAIYGVNPNDSYLKIYTQCSGKQDIDITSIPEGSSVSGGVKLLPSKDIILRSDIMKKA